MNKYCNPFQKKIKFLTWEEFSQLRWKRTTPRSRMSQRQNRTYHRKKKTKDRTHTKVNNRRKHFREIDLLGKSIQKESIFRVLKGLLLSFMGLKKDSVGSTYLKMDFRNWLETLRSIISSQRKLKEMREEEAKTQTLSPLLSVCMYYSYLHLKNHHTTLSVFASSASPVLPRVGLPLSSPAFILVNFFFFFLKKNLEIRMGLACLSAHLTLKFEPQIGPIDVLAHLALKFGPSDA